MVLGLLKPLGVWGIAGFAAVDSAVLGMPLDVIVAGYVWANPHRLLLYCALASAGGALGSSLWYVIGYKGGEVLLVKRIGEKRFRKIQASFEQHEFLALMLPSMLPPPTPFKLFVLSAGVAEVRFGHFLAAIFSGRFVRFVILSFLVIRFGPGIVDFLGSMLHHHLRILIAVLAGGALLGWWIWRARKLRLTRDNS